MRISYRPSLASLAVSRGGGPSPFLTEVIRHDDELKWPARKRKVGESLKNTASQMTIAY